jgi:hypothetical protein
MRLTPINHNSSMNIFVSKLAARQVLAEFSLPAGSDYEASKPLIAEALAKAFEAGEVEEHDVENLLQRLSMAGVTIGDIHKEAQFWQNMGNKAKEWVGKAQEGIGNITKDWAEKGKATQQNVQNQRQERQKTQESAAAEQARKQQEAVRSAENIASLDKQRTAILTAYGAYSQAVSTIANMPGGNNYANMLRMLDHTYLSKLLTYPIQKPPDEQFAKYYQDLGIQTGAQPAPATSAGVGAGGAAPSAAAPVPAAPAVPAKV